MEQIRRANRLFANDSLFLREFLMVPVDKDSPFYPKDAERPHSFPQRANTIATCSTSPTSTPSSSSKDSPNKSMDSVMASPEEEQRKDLESFLDKIDSSIATSKKFVQEQQKNSNFVVSSQSDDNIYGMGNNSYNSFTNHNYEVAHSSTSSYQQYFQQPVNNSHQYARHSLGAKTLNSTTTNGNGNNSSHGNDSTQLIVMTKGKRIKNSLQRLERQSDEMFEL